MSERIKVKPARAGLIIRDPDNGFKQIPDEGIETKRSVYWHRHEAQGSVTITEIKGAAKKADKAEAKG